MSKRPKLAYHQRTTADNNREETSASVVEYEYTGKDHHVPNNVTHVRIHSSITKIEKYTFHTKLHLKEVVLNDDGLTVIGSNAFCNCMALQSITLPSTLIKIGKGAFKKHTELREVVLNSGLREIGESAFQECTALESITLLSAVTDIGSDTFAGCSSLTEK